MKETLIVEKDNQKKERKNKIIDFLIPLTICAAIFYWNYLFLIKYPGFINLTNIELIKVSNYDELSLRAGKLVEQEIKKKKDLFLGLSSGFTSFGTYLYLIEKYKRKEISFKEMQAINIEEYYGLDKNDNHSMSAFINKNFLSKIDIKEKNIHFLSYKNKQEKDLKNINKLLEEKPLDLLILSFGLNTQIGSNEPFTPLDAGVHISNLTVKSIDEAALYFENDEKKVPKRAVTIGLKNILNAKKIILLANGRQKGLGIKKLFGGMYDPSFPVTSLSKYKGKIIVIADEEACSFLPFYDVPRGMKRYSEGNTYGIKKGLYYEFWEGRTRKDINIVVLHGAAGNHYSYMPLKEYLTDFNMYFINLPGIYRSEKTGYHNFNYARAILDFTEDMKNVIFIGHSMGGFLAYEILSKNHPSAIGGVVISATNYATMSEEDVNKMKRGINMPLIAKNLLDFHTDNEWFESAKFFPLDNYIKLKNFLTTVNYPIDDTLKKIDVPILLIGGKRDYMIKLDSFYKAKEILKNSTLVLVERGNHYSPLRYKKKYSLIIKEFIEKNWPNSK